MTQNQDINALTALDLSNPKNIVKNSEPIPMPVSELLTGGYQFSIPSYQRGYRWESRIDEKDQNIRQVDDLLNDLQHFLSNNTTGNYYLQPLMVKPRYDNDRLVWDVLDGQQRLTTLLLLLKCINEKLFVPDEQLPLYSISYTNRPEIDFCKITYNNEKPQDFNYPIPSDNLDSFFVKKAKDRILDWFNDNIKGKTQIQDKLKDALFYADSSRGDNSNPNLRVLFIWYNAQPILHDQVQNSGVSNDIAIFNRLNGGKINLTDSELLKALFLLCIKVDKNNNGTCIIDDETLVRKWDEMERKFHDDEFWNMMVGQNRTYENRLDFLFDFIRESDNSKQQNSYRYFYNDMRGLLKTENSKKIEQKWELINTHFDILCKWHENITFHNYVGYLVECGTSVASILKKVKESELSTISTIKNLVKETIKTDELESLRYGSDSTLIKKILLLFNVETSERHRERFSFKQYRAYKYDIEHINSQTENAIVNPQERLEWIENQALASLKEDRKNNYISQKEKNNIERLIKEGLQLKKEEMKQEKFNSYRQEVEQYYACDGKSEYEKDWIGNLALLNSKINREYHNALFPRKLETIKCRDQEGEYIPPCTRYLFMKYYSDIKGNPSAFSMMRWTDNDQRGYFEKIKETLNKFLQ